MSTVTYRLTLSATESPGLTALAIEECRSPTELARLMVTDGLKKVGCLPGNPIRPDKEHAPTYRHLPAGSNRRLVLKLTAEEASALSALADAHKRRVHEQARHLIREQLAAAGLLPDDPITELELLCHPTASDYPTETENGRGNCASGEYRHR